MKSTFSLAVFAVSLSQASAAVVFTDDFVAAPPSTFGDNFATTINDLTGSPLIDFKLDLRSPTNANLIWNGGNTQSHPVSGLYNDFGVLGSAISGGVDFASNSGGGVFPLANGAVWGFNTILFSDSTFNGDAPVALGFILNDVNGDGNWNSGDTADILGVAYDPTFATDVTNMVFNAAMTRAVFPVVPEPSRAALCAAGFSLMTLRRRRG